MRRKRLAVGCLVGGLLVAVNLVILLSVGVLDSSGPGSARDDGGQAAPTVATLPPSFTSATSVVKPLNELYTTTTSHPPTTTAAGSPGSSPTGGEATQAGKGGPTSKVLLHPTPQNTVATVSYNFSGDCVATGGRFKCHLLLTASDNLESGGFVTVYPSVKGKQDCGASEPLARDSVTIEGSCATPYATKVLAIFSLTPGIIDSPLSSAYIPWS